MQDEIQKLIEMYRLQDDKFEDYKNKELMTLTTGAQPSKDKTLIIVGGQSGAGKSRLITTSNEELERNAVIVNFDELRSAHPFYQEVSRSYSEIVHRILHSDTEKVKNEILQILIEKGYNVIYEGALRNTQGFVDFANKFKENGYKIKMNVMAVPKLESYGSTFVRYALALLTNNTPRWVEKTFHDSSYEGVIKTVQEFENKGIVDDISVFVRGDSSEKNPKKIYSKEGRQYRDSITAIEAGRESGRRQAVQDYPTKFQMVKDVFEKKQPELLGNLKEWEELYSQEVEHFNFLNRDVKSTDYIE